MKKIQLGSKIKAKRFSIVSNTFKNLTGRIKKAVLIRFYWGRGGGYKRFFHFAIILITFLVVFAGISTRLSEVTSERVITFEDTSIAGNVDTLQQGVGIQTINRVSPISFKVHEYTVKDGDSLESIANAFNVSQETVQWANSSKIDYFLKKVNPGDQLVIPEINGVLYEVKEGDTLDSVLSKTEGNRFEVIEINQLQSPDFNLIVGSRILIPNGKLPPPPPPPPIIYRTPVNIGVNIATNANYAKLNDIAFVNPLSNPDCAGYSWNRGFLPWHNGVDLGKFGGCSIRAAAAGTVIFAGLSYYGEGYNVRIDHGNGVQTLYFHGSGDIWVRAGQQVSAGQEIMFMGCSGYCTGTHLHLSLRVDGIFIDPAPYIPY